MPPEFSQNIDFEWSGPRCSSVWSAISYLATLRFTTSSIRARLVFDEGIAPKLVLILFDLSKAFDSIPHARLLAKLRALNMSDHALRWFFSYLADRIQTVIDDGGSLSD